MDELLKLREFSVDYKVKGGYLSAVREVSLDIHKGEIFALVGESGCGKTTLANAILKLLPERSIRESGEILFDNADLVKASQKELEAIRGHRIGMIFQNPMESLNPVYTVGRQVREGLLLDKLPPREAWEKVISLFEEVQMPDPGLSADKFPHELSGGMRQRAMIAMMIGRNPELLVADEPTTALDVTIEAQVLKVIKKLRDERGMAVLLITHNFGVVAQIADRVGVMYAGEIVETGTVRDIFDSPKHPYTKQLLRALPRIYKSEGRLDTIPGSVPRILNGSKGCRFANRCTDALPECFTDEPLLNDAGITHSFRCFKP